MHPAKRIARSLLRIALGVGVASTVLFCVLAAVLRQPVWTSSPFPGAHRTSAATLEKHVQYLTTDLAPRGAAEPENLDRTAAYIAAQFRAAHARTRLQTFEARGRRYTNVIAEFGPASSREPLTIIGAHYDAFTETGPLPGADDNASGTAGLLELARLLAADDVRRPVHLVAYANEEPPFFGSDHMGSAVHAHSLASSGNSVAGTICLETSDASDHRNYWSHGWPAVMVTDTAFLRNPNYHTRNDTADTLDYQKMARVVDGVLTAVLSM